MLTTTDYIYIVLALVATLNLLVVATDVAVRINGRKPKLVLYNAGKTADQGSLQIELTNVGERSAKVQSAFIGYGDRKLDAVTFTGDVVPSRAMVVFNLKDNFYHQLLANALDRSGSPSRAQGRLTVTWSEADGTKQTTQTFPVTFYPKTPTDRTLTYVVSDPSRTVP